MAAAPSTPDAPVVGIDLGMTSVVAAHVPGPGEVPELIGFERGAATLPAVVALPRAGHGAAVLGRSAVRAVTTDPPRAIWGLKRLLGRRFDSQAVKELRARVGFAIAGGPDGLAAVEIDGQRHGVPDLVAHLFAEVRRASERDRKSVV